MESLWNWLSNDRNRQVLGFIGGGIAALIGAAWAVFVFVVDHGEAKKVAAAPAAISPGVAAAAANDDKAKANALDQEATVLNGIADQISAANKPAKK